MTAKRRTLDLRKGSFNEQCTRAIGEMRKVKKRQTAKVKTWRGWALVPNDDHIVYAARLYWYKFMALEDATEKNSTLYRATVRLEPVERKGKRR